MKRDTIISVLIILVVVGCIAGGLYLAYWAPCSAYRWNPASQVPARCIKEFTR